MNDFGSLTEICLKVFNASVSYTNAFFPVLFLIRIAYANITGAGSSEYTDAIKGSITYWVLILGFPYILDVLLLLPTAFLPDFNAAESLSQENLEANSAQTVENVPYILRNIMEALTAIIYYAATSIHFIFVITMCGIAPIVILFATMLGLGVGVKIFFGLMILASCWPILWAAFDAFNKWVVLTGGNSFGSLVTELLVQILKALGPLWVSSMALKSGPGKALTGAASGVMTNFSKAGSLGAAISGGAAGAASSIGSMAGITPNPNAQPRDLSGSNISSISDPGSRFGISPNSLASSAQGSGPQALNNRDLPSSAAPGTPRFPLAPTANNTASSASLQGSSAQNPQGVGQSSTNSAQASATKAQEERAITSSNTGSNSSVSAQQASNTQSTQGIESFAAPAAASLSSPQVSQSPISNATQGSSSIHSTASQTAASDPANPTPRTVESSGSRETAQPNIAPSAQSMSSAQSGTTRETTVSNPAANSQTASSRTNQPQQTHSPASDINSLAMQQMLTDSGKRRKRG